MNDFSLLQTLCGIHAPSGNEEAMTTFLLNYVEEHKSSWSSQPRIYSGEGFQNCIVLVFGKPRTAVFAHIDNIGYTVRYNQELIPIGAPHARSGTLLWSRDHDKQDECKLEVVDEQFSYRARQPLPRGTSLSFRPDWREDEKYIQCCYMDNRLGVWTALQLCTTLKDGVVAFSCWEEHGGGSVAVLSKFLYEKYAIRQALVCDITWVTEGVVAGGGVAVSLRDSRIPRKKFVDHIVRLARESGIPFQLEVERSGGSDGTELQKQPYPIDWCFVGAPEQHVHTPDEKVHKADAIGMLQLYRYLLEKL